MRSIDGFLLVGGGALVALVAVFVLAQRRANVSVPAVPAPVAVVAPVVVPLAPVVAAVAVKLNELDPGMRCVGGVVIRVQGSVYTQVMSRGSVVRCSGRFADKPVR